MPNGVVNHQPMSVFTVVLMCKSVGVAPVHRVWRVSHPVRRVAPILCPVHRVALVLCPVHPVAPVLCPVHPVVPVSRPALHVVPVRLPPPVLYLPLSAHPAVRAPRRSLT